MTHSLRTIARCMLATLLGALVLSGMTSPAQAREMAAHPAPAGVGASGGQMPLWVLQADKYVRVVNGVAVVSPEIHMRLNPATVRQVLQSVAHFNALDRQYRMGDVRINIPARSQNGVVMAGCKNQITISYKWWGQQYWLNSCTVNTITHANGGVTGIAMAITRICPACGVVAGVLAGVVAVYANWLQWADQYCGGQGVYMNRPWMGPGWVSRVC